jgi:hypothetical protein
MPTFVPVVRLLVGQTSLSLPEPVRSWLSIPVGKPCKNVCTALSGRSLRISSVVPDGRPAIYLPIALASVGSEVTVDALQLVLEQLVLEQLVIVQLGLGQLVDRQLDADTVLMEKEVTSDWSVTTEGHEVGTETEVR